MSVRRDHFALVGLALAGVMVAAACFSHHSPTATSTSAICTLPLGPGVDGSTLIAIRDFSFQPNDVRVKAGSSVRSRLEGKNKLYIIGGTGLKTVYAYDPVTNKETTKAPLLTGRYWLAAAALITPSGNPKILAVGGRLDHGGGVQ